jgi:RIO kinase 1
MIEGQEGKAFDKLDKKIDQFIREYKFRLKDKDDRETIEEVIDRSTLITLYNLMNQGYIEELYGVVAAGKEARVYSAIDGDGNPLAIKIFLTLTTEFRKSRIKYLIGDPRFEGIYNSPLKMIYAWASKEYKNLIKAHEAGVYVPKPIVCSKNVIVMEFIGREFRPAPTLREYKNPNKRILHQVLRQIRRLYQKAGLVHADMSEYNIFYYKRKPILFDFGQAVVLGHPMAESFLVRDINNILKFFRNRGVDVELTPEEALEYIRGGRDAV